jgi:hypothetical protein
MLQARPHAIHFKRILDFGEGQDQPSKIIGRDPERPGVPRTNDLAFSGESKKSIGMS